MSKPKPPCGRKCPDRSVDPNCHDQAVCPKWGAYQEALLAFRELAQREHRKLDDYHAVRSTPDVIRRKKRGESD